MFERYENTGLILVFLCLFARENRGWLSICVFYYAKSSENFGPKVNGTVRPGGPAGNFPVNKWFTSRGPVQPKLWFIFRNSRFQSRSSTSLYTVVKMVDDSDVSVCECNVCPGGYSGFQVTGMIEGFFWVWNFRFRNFLGTKIWQVFFWVAWFE